MNNIDWAGTGAWMQAWAGFAQAIAIGVAAAIGGSSFRNWLKQNRTERKLIVGERILTFALKARDAFSSIRNPAQFIYEVERAEREIAEASKDRAYTADVRHSVVVCQVILDRMTDQNEVWKELFECRSLGRIFFGGQMEEAIFTFWKLRNAVRIAAMMYPTTPQSDLRSKFERDFWEGAGGVPGGPGDEVGVAVRAAVELIESLILPLVAEPGDRRSNGQNG